MITHTSLCALLALAIWCVVGTGAASIRHRGMQPPDSPAPDGAAPSPDGAAPPSSPSSATGSARPAIPLSPLTGLSISDTAYMYHKHLYSPAKEARLWNNIAIAQQLGAVTNARGTDTWESDTPFLFAPALARANLLYPSSNAFAPGAYSVRANVYATSSLASRYPNVRAVLLRGGVPTPGAWPIPQLAPAPVPRPVEVLTPKSVANRFDRYYALEQRVFSAAHRAAGTDLLTPVRVVPSLAALRQQQQQRLQLRQQQQQQQARSLTVVANGQSGIILFPPVPTPLPEAEPTLEELTKRGQPKKKAEKSKKAAADSTTASEASPDAGAAPATAPDASAAATPATAPDASAAAPATPPATDASSGASTPATAPDAAGATPPVGPPS